MRYQASVSLPVSTETAFAYHERPGCLDRLIPPWESVTIERSDGSLRTGSRVVLKTRLLGIPLRWVAEHTVYEPPRRFCDRQVSGPFACWEHEHRFDEITAGSDRGSLWPDAERIDPQAIGGSASTLTDRIDYRLPGGPLGRFLGGGKALQTIEAMFAYRHRVTADDLSLAARYPLTTQTVAVSGAGGLVGSSLCQLLTLLGHRVLRIVRGDARSEDEVPVWADPTVAAERLEGIDAVIHLAGKSIADQRWNDQVRSEIRDSRVVKTARLAELLAGLRDKPSVLISASATGIYGNRGDERLSETSPLGDDFLSGVAEEWEAACDAARQAGIRVVHPRFGVVLSPRGGALQKMLTPAKFCGGSLGSGKQWWSWIALDDVLGGLVHALATDSLAGPVNFVAPEPVKNREFASTLGRVLSRPALLPAPAIALRLALGEMADALLLASTRVDCDRLRDSGYHFRFPSLEPCLRYLLGKVRSPSETSPAPETSPPGNETPPSGETPEVGP